MKRDSINSISDEMLIAMIMALDSEEKNSLKQKKLLSLLKHSEKSYKEARDKDYTIVDEELKETSKNFFQDKSDIFEVSNILDDDDLSYFDKILNSRKDA